MHTKATAVLQCVYSKQLPKEFFSPITLECQDEKMVTSVLLRLFGACLVWQFVWHLMWLGQRLSFINFTEFSQVAVVGDVGVGGVRPSHMLYDMYLITPTPLSQQPHIK